MERIKRSLSTVPPWLFSILTLVAILWLTLAPRPLGEEMPPLFEGADKIAHAIMFGGWAIMLLLDWQRRHVWNPVPFLAVFIAALLSSILGAVIEVLQTVMGLGRGFEYGDIIADTVGAYIFAFLYLFMQKYWTTIK